MNGISLADARRDLAQRHGLSSWAELTRRVRALASGEEPPTAFMLAYRAVEEAISSGCGPLRLSLAAEPGHLQPR